MGREEAHASWNGFNYQGKISLLVAMEQLNKIDMNKAESWSLEIEGLDDFAIKENGKYHSIHQVKNYNSSEYSRYEEALIKLGKKEKGVCKYIHARLEFKFILSKKLEQLTRIQTQEISDENIECCKNEYFKFYNDTNDITKKKAKERVSERVKILHSGIKRLGIKSRSELTKEIVRKILVDYNKTIEENKDIDLNYMSVYKYNNGEEFIDSKKCIELIKEEILKYWGNKSNYKKESIDVYYIKLVTEIDKMISLRAEEKSLNKEISFLDIANILDGDLPVDKEYKILEYISKLENAYFEICPDLCECDVPCMNGNKCSISEIIKGINNSELDSVEKIIRALDFSNKDDLGSSGQEVINKDRIQEILYKTIVQVNKEFELSDYKIICKSDTEASYAMATTIKKSENPKIQDKSFENMRINEQINKLFKDVTVGYEIDDVITQNLSGDIKSLKPSFYEDDEEQSYNKITNNKNVKFITIEEACEKYGDRKK